VVASVAGPVRRGARPDGTGHLALPAAAPAA
jgi:hypothetical protein